MHFNPIISRHFSTLKNTKFSAEFNSKIRALVQQGQYIQALQIYSEEPNFSANTSRFTYPSLIKACARLTNLEYGNILHAKIAKMGLDFDPYITTSLINMYVRCRSFDYAVKLFENVSECKHLVRDVTLLNSMIDGFFKNGVFDEGMLWFRRMQAWNINPDGYTLSILLGTCNDNGFLGLINGKEIHGYMVRNAFDNDPFLVTALIEMYSSFCHPLDAWNVFDMLHGKCSSIAVWNAMIKGFFENGCWRNGLGLYQLVKREDLELGSTTFASALKACSQGADIDFGRQLHCDVVKFGFERDPYVISSLLTLYARFRSIEDSQKVFSGKVEKEVEVWNSMIAAYVSLGCSHDALDIFYQMHTRAAVPDSATMSNVLVACSMAELSDVGKMIHGELMKKPIKDDATVQSALLTMYSRFGCVDDACMVFNEMAEKDVVAWGCMISGNCENKKFKEALDLFKEVEYTGVKLDFNVMATAISACVALDDTKLGFCIHGMAIKRGLEVDAFTGRSLIEFYSRCGHPEMAKNVFSDITDKNLVVWNSLISCYSRNDLPDISISLLPEMMRHGLHPDSVSITSVLVAISMLAALVKGKATHCYYLRHQNLRETQVENALIEMYIQCGCLEYAGKSFHTMHTRNLVTWNTMIAGYGYHGKCHKAIDLFNEMIESATLPDEITFQSLISSCNHAGLVDEGLDIFQLMREYRIEPKMEHYTNIVDLLGRAGCLNDAYSFTQRMAISPGQGVWQSLLNACRVHSNVVLGELSFHHLLKLDPTSVGNYVQMSNLYLEDGLQDKAANLRALMRKKGLVKVPGCSYIQVKDEVDIFYSGDSSSPRTAEICETLNSLRSTMKRKERYHEVSVIVYESLL